MLILGLNSGDIGQHDPSAVLIEDGKILTAIEEERFVGIKHAPGMYPLNATKYILKEHSLKISDIDKITYYAEPNLVDLLKRWDAKRPYTIAGGLDFIGK